MLLLGGLAVIAHGMARANKDANVWLDPLASAEAWAAALVEEARAFPKVRIARLPGWTAILTAEEIAAAAEETGIVRVLGLECALDIIRRPNELEEGDFDEVWSRAVLKEDGVYLPDPTDLLVSKSDTGRDRDNADIAFLESKLRTNFGAQLKTATRTEAEEIFARYTDHVVASRAMENPDPAVQALAREILEDLAAQGDPFARDALGR